MATQPQAGRGNTLLFVICAYLIFRLVYRLAIPGGSWPMPPWHIVSMVIDVVLLLSVIVLRTAAPKADIEQRPSWAAPLIWGAIAAGVGALLLRFTSDAAWWTGHLT